LEPQLAAIPRKDDNAAAKDADRILQQQRTLSLCISHDRIRISIALCEEEEEKSSSNSRDSLPRNKIK
jgi:hypothetical protein